MISPAEEQAQREAVIAEALRWLRTPYRYGQRVHGAGVDCALFPAEVFQACGLIPRIDPPAILKDWNMHKGGEEHLLNWILRYARKVEAPKPADIGLFSHGTKLAHASIVLSWPRLIHAVEDSGVCYDNAECNRRLKGHFHGFYRLHAWSD